MSIQNTNNKSAAAILKSNSVGVGKTSHLPELYKLEADNVFHVAGHEPVTLSENLIRAKFVHWFHNEYKNADKDKILAAFAGDFLTPFHMRQAEKGEQTQVKNSVISSLDYRKNYIRHNINSITFEQVTELLAESEKADKLTKTELLDLVLKFSNLFEKEEEKETYIIKLEKEEDEKRKFVKLEEAGFSDIKSISEFLFSANVPLANATQIAGVLEQSNFVLISSNINFEEQVVNITFQDKPE